jgi:hypothetical protein
MVIVDKKGFNMRILGTLVCLVIGFSVSGNAFARTNVEMIEPQVKVGTLPPYGQEASREAGETLFYDEVLKTYSGIRFEDGQIARFGPSGFLLPKPFINDRRLNGENSYCGIGHQVKALFGTVNGPDIGLCFTEKMLKEKNLKFSQTIETVLDVKNFRREIVYQGKVGKELRISYREYINDMARSSFSQELNFEYSEGTVIAVKGSRIEVIKADNTGIIYRVIKGFERP